ncbi:MAG: effector-associated domain EAD1-containing protein [Leptolyngbyaceae cyanobacterium MO_188.B28]|nr:effector-associated domain EAD1-containing protein [Leptolyngbyaceae cyanobacterium MO_188.B28]
MPNPNSIFVSYRRIDSNDVTGRIYDFLAAHFGGDVVFKDVDSIPLGVDFRTYLNDTVGNCQVLVAVIGPNWLEALKERLGQPAIDWVRAEIETALGRGIPVIPLLVGGAGLPVAADLPEGLQDLAYRNAAQARPDPDFKSDMHRLIQGLESIVGASSIASSAKIPVTLTPQQMQGLQNALLSAFQDEDEFAMMVQFYLQRPLNRISRARTYDKVVFDVIQWVNGRNKVADFVNGARETNPDNSELLQFIQSLS